MKATFHIFFMLLIGLVVLVGCGDSQSPPTNGQCNFDVPPGSIIQLTTPDGNTSSPHTGSGVITAPCGSNIEILAQFQ